MPHLTCRNGSEKEETQWLRECERRRIPFVVVRLGNKFAEVFWDCASVDIVSDLRFGSHQAELTDAICDLYRRYRPGSINWEFHAHCAEIDRLTPAEANLLAEEVYRVLTEALAASQTAGGCVTPSA